MDQFPDHQNSNKNSAVALGPTTPGTLDTNSRGYGYGNHQFELYAEPPGVDFYKYIRILTKYRKLVAATVVLFMILAVVVTFLMTPIYRATASIQIDRVAMNVVKVDGLQPDDSQSGGLEFYQTQYELLSSRTLAEKVVSSLGLVNDSKFSVASTNPFSLTSLIKKLIYGNETGIQNTQLGEDEKKRKVVDKLLLSLGIAPVRGSKIVKISIDQTNPALAQKIANGYAETFIADSLDRRYDANSYARKFLENHLAQLKQKLSDSEKELVKYAGDQGIIAVDNEKSMSIVDLTAIDAKLADVRSDRIKKELLWKQAQATGGLGLKEILDSSIVQENLKQSAALKAQYEQKLAIFKPAYPEMIQLRNQINELDSELRLQVDSIKQSIQADYLEAKKHEDALQVQLEEGKSNVVDQQNRSIQYNILKREVDTNRTLYDGLLQRYKEIGVAGGVGTNNISVVDHATQPISPTSPRLGLNLILALICGFMLGCALALGLDYLDDSFKSPDEIERELGLTALGVVPKPRAGGTMEDELLDARSSLSEAFRSLRTGLQFSTSEGLPRTLLITSSQPSEGKTTTTISLAHTLANIGLNVLMIDGDLRNASIHRRLGISNELGLSNYLSGKMKPEEITQESDKRNLVIITAGPLPPNPAELLSGPKFSALLARATEAFDIVLVDGPPVMGLADAPLIGSQTQASLLVVAANETRRNTVRFALRRLLFARANIIGALLNKFDVKQTNYGYGYGYGDYNYYGYGSNQALVSPPEPKG